MNALRPGSAGVEWDILFREGDERASGVQRNTTGPDRQHQEECDQIKILLFTLALPATNIP